MLLRVEGRKLPWGLRLRRTKEAPGRLLLRAKQAACGLLLPAEQAAGCLRRAKGAGAGLRAKEPTAASE